MKSAIPKPLRRLARILLPRQAGARDSLDLWERRAADRGRYAVLHSGHSESEYDLITRQQRDELFPVLQSHLRGDERLVLDFGCGPGRFTPELAELINGKAVGVDPIQRFLDMATAGPRVEYRIMSQGRIPVANESVDVIWVCLVLGGLTDPAVLDRTIVEMDRVLSPGGLIFLVENTTEKPSPAHWAFRSSQAYQDRFGFGALQLVHEYFDLGERISVLCGRKHTDSALP